jgi:hypothetical protein
LNNNEGFIPLNESKARANSGVELPDFHRNSTEFHPAAGDIGKGLHKDVGCSSEPEYDE